MSLTDSLCIFSLLIRHFCTCYLFFFFVFFKHGFILFSSWGNFSLKGRGCCLVTKKLAVQILLHSSKSIVYARHLEVSVCSVVVLALGGCDCGVM